MKTAEPLPDKVPLPPRKFIVARALDEWRRLSAGQRLRLKSFLAFAVILTLAFIRPLVSLMVYTSGTDLHSHIVLVPVISAYLLYINWQKLPSAFITSTGWGLLLLAAGFAFLGSAWFWHHATPGLSLNDRHVLPVLAWVSLLAAGGFFFLGREWMAAAAFPVAFLLFMAPLPDAVVHVLETASQHASAEAARWYFELAGIPFLRDEQDSTLFMLPGIGPMMVGEECSGIRSSWVLFITSLVAGYMFLKSPWRRLIFVSLVIPLGILRNGFRILVIAWLCVEVGPHMIDSFVHHKGGPIFFALSLVPLFLILWWLRRGEVRAARQTAGRANPKPVT